MNEKQTAAGDRERVPADEEGMVGKVRERYGRIAAGEISGCCSGNCGSDVEADVARRLGYDDGQLEAVPAGANLGLGCGAPIAALDLQAGETVLDLGSGAGFDAFLAAREVGPSGTVIGVDMTPEMLEKARANAQQDGLDHVEFREGRLEDLPIDDASIDAVTSNCVINLVPDKARVFAEVARVLRPGGRIVISDIVLDGELPDAVRTDLLAYVGCVAGAMPREAYFEIVRQAGLVEIEVLQDRDYLASMDSLLPDEVVELLQRTGVTVEEVRGVVHSLTFRAVRPV